MIRLGNKIKLSSADNDDLYALTRAVPVLRDVASYNAYIERHMALHDQNTPEARLLHSLLADKRIQD